MRKVFYGLFGLVLALLLVVVIAPSFVDWNSQKVRFTQEVRDATGRELIIDGDMSFAILPAPTLSAAGVRFANIEGGSDPFMAAIKELQVNVALLPLLQGQIQIKRVALVEPRILFEILPNGQTNWQFEALQDGASDEGNAQGGSQESDSFAEQIRIDSFTVKDGDLIYRDHIDGREEHLGELNVEFVAESLTGPLTAKGTAEFKGIDTGFNFAVGRIVRSGATPVNLTLTLPAADAEVQFTGSVSQHADDFALRGRLKGHGANLVAAAASLGEPEGLPPLLAQPFDLQFDVTADLAGATASNLELRAGELALTGEIVAQFGPPFDVHATLASTRIDLDALRASALSAGFGDSTTTEEARPPTAPPAETVSLAELTKDIKARLDLTVEGLIHNQQAVRQIRFDAFLEEGRVTLGQAMALLPGGSDFALSGAINLKAEDPSFEGRATLASSNLRVLLAWLGADLATLPPDRLRSLNLKTRIQGTAKQISLSELDVTLDLSRITGGIVVAVRDRPGFGIGLSMDSLNLDSYLPAPGAETQAGEKDSSVGESGGTGPSASGLAVLQEFDANVSFRIGSLTFKGNTAKDVRLEAGLKDGTVTVKQGSYADFAGSQGRWGGTLSDLAEAPRVEGELAISVRDPLRLARAFDLDPAGMARLGAFELTSGVRGTEKNLVIDGMLEAQGAQIRAKGALQPGTQPMTFDLVSSVRHPDLAGLAKVFDLPLTLGPAVGALDLNGRVSGSLESFEIKDLSGVVGPLTLSGLVQLEPAAAKGPIKDSNLALRLVHGDLNGLMADLGQAIRFAPDIGGADLEGTLSGNGRNLNLTALSGRLGPVALTGRLAADLSGDRPALTAEFATSSIPLAAFDASPSAAGGSSSAGGDQSTGQRWSAKALDLSVLRDFDGTLDLTAEAITKDDLRLDNAVLKTQLREGLLDIQKLSGTAYKGAVQLIGKLDARRTPVLAISVTAIEVQLGDLLRDQADFDRVDGPVNLDLSVSSQGSSEQALVSALAGQGKIDGSLKVKVSAGERLGGLALDILGAKINEIQGIADVTTTLLNSFGGAQPAALTGTFQIEEGVVATRDLLLQNPEARAETVGQASLPSWRLDSKTDAYSREKGDKPYLTVKLTGPLDAPNIGLSGSALERKDQGTSGGGEAPAEVPSDGGLGDLPIPGDIKPEDLIKDLLKGLGG